MDCDSPHPIIESLQVVQLSVAAEIDRRLAQFNPKSNRERVAKRFCDEYMSNGCPPIYLGKPTHFTASAMVVHENSVLLQRHLAFDRWVFLGGHVDPTDPNPWSAARREVTEESGLSLHLDDLPLPLMHIDLINGKHGHKHVDLTFGFTAAERIPPTPPKHESQMIDWIDLRTAFALTPSRMTPAFERLLEIDGIHLTANKATKNEVNIDTINPHPTSIEL